VVLHSRLLRSTNMETVGNMMISKSMQTCNNFVYHNINEFVTVYTSIRVNQQHSRFSR